MELTFLGTGSMVPTKERNVVGHFLDYKGDCLLIDCGEGTQRQMNLAGINRLRVSKILITHWHGDHVAGLLGLMQTISNSENPQLVKLFGPKGSKENFKNLMKATHHVGKIDVEIKELKPKGIEKFFETDEYYLECIALEHSTEVLAYRFVEKDQRRINMTKVKKLGLKEGPLVGKLKEGKEVTFNGKKIKPDDVSKIQEGKKIAFVFDTRICDSCFKIAEDVDLLICEATHKSDLEEKALKYKHLTSAQAAQIASRANVEKLIITHFSQRYTNVDELLEEAKTIFPNTVAANDFMKVTI